MRKVWRIYFYVWLGATILIYASYPFLMQIGEPISTREALLHVFFDVAGLIGLYGYAWRKPIGNALIWKLIFIGIFFYAVESWFLGPEIPIEDFHSLSLGERFKATVVLLFSAMYFIAIFSYGFASKVIWRRETEITT